MTTSTKDREILGKLPYFVGNFMQNKFVIDCSKAIIKIRGKNCQKLQFGA